MSPAELHELAALLNRDDVFDLVAGAIADSRDGAHRDPDDRDSAEVLTDIIAALRSA